MGIPSLNMKSHSKFIPFFSPWKLNMQKSHSYFFQQFWVFSIIFSGSPNRWDRWYTITQLAVYTTYHLYIAFWGVICYLSPIKGTRNLHWCFVPLRKRSFCLKKIPKTQNWCFTSLVGFHLGFDRDFRRRNDNDGFAICLEKCVTSQRWQK